VEDCLQLNVWTPKSRTDGTVMVFFHGGAFQGGWPGTAELNGAHMAASQKVVVVTATYRLGLLGFPSANEIPLGERNLGFLDQREALKWVQRNIKAFGGE